MNKNKQMNENNKQKTKNKSPSKNKTKQNPPPTLSSKPIKQDKTKIFGLWLLHYWTDFKFSTFTLLARPQVFCPLPSKR